MSSIDEDVLQSSVAISQVAWRHIPTDDMAVGQVTGLERQIPLSAKLHLT
jgi:hypothetical protein